MIESVSLLGFLTLGLLGGFGHCVGMCSPFVLFVSRRFVAVGGGRAPVLGAQGWYTAGRILTYAVLGAAAGALGSVVELAGGLLGLQRLASIVAGGVLIVWALVALSDLVPGLQTGGSLFARVAGALKGRVPSHPFVMGLFLGLLPCGGLGFLCAALVLRAIPVEKIKDYVGVPEINPAVGVITILILLSIEIVSGLMPARRAASTNPIEALRK